MKFSLLLQPRNPLFWLMLAVNALSFPLAFIAQTWTLNTLGAVLVAGFAVSNALLGLFLAWRLMHTGKRKD